LKNKYFFDINSDLINQIKRRVLMGLVMVCPQCQANVLLQTQNCPYCQADLRNLSQDQRRYVLGQPGPSTPPPPPETAVESAPVIESAGVPEPAVLPAPASEVKIRRPHVRRYAAPPVSVTHPVAGKSSQTKEAAESKPAAKKAKKPVTKKKK
jgi:hypothetical protein